MVNDLLIREFFDLEDNAMVTEKQQADGSWKEIVSRRPLPGDEEMVEAAIRRHRQIKQIEGGGSRLGHVLIKNR